MRNFKGVMHFNGEIYEVQGTSLARLHHEPELGDWLNVAILAQEDLYGGQYVVKCGVRYPDFFGHSGLVT